MALSAFYQLPLSEQGLLLYIELFADQQRDNILSSLSDDIRTSLQPAQTELKGIAPEQRLSTLSGLFKHVRKSCEQQLYIGLHPSWIAYELHAEQPYMTALIIQSMPPTVAEQVMKYIPKQIIDLFPPKGLLNSISEGYRQSVINHFEGRFPRNKKLKYLQAGQLETLVHLTHHDFQHIIVELGVHELAEAFKSSPKRTFATFLKQTHRALAERLITHAKKVEFPPSPESAKTTLTIVKDVMQNDKELYVKAGLYRLAKALIDQPTHVWETMAYALHRGWGKMLLEFRSDSPTHDAPESLRRDIHHVVEKLARRGKIKGLTK